MKSFSRAAVAVLCALGLLTAAAPAQAQGPKLAFIYSADIIAQHPGRPAAEALFNKEATAWDTRKGIMQDSLNALFAAFQKDQATLSAADRDARDKALVAKQDAYQLEAQTREDSLQKLQEDLVAPMRDLLVTVLTTVRNEDQYAFIFDASAPNGLIVAVDKNLDITDKVLVRYLAAAKAAPAPAAPPAASARPGTPPPATGTAGRPAGATRPPQQ